MCWKYKNKNKNKIRSSSIILSQVVDSGPRKRSSRSRLLFLQSCGAHRIRLRLTFIILVSFWSSCSTSLFGEFNITGSRQHAELLITYGRVIWTRSTNWRLNCNHHLSEFEHYFGQLANVLLCGLTVGLQPSFFCGWALFRAVDDRAAEVGVSSMTLIMVWCF
jgi:hypothetical protein